MAVYLVRLARGQARLERLPVDGPFLAFCVWTLLSASFSPSPVVSHQSAKKLVLFALFYVAVDTLTRGRTRERVLDAVTLGGLVLSAGALLQYYFLGYHTLNNRPHSFLGHYMTASGLIMGVTVLCAARLALRRAPLPAPTRRDLVALGLLVLALALLSGLQAADLFAVEAERLCVAGLAVVAGYWVVGRGTWPGTDAGALLAALTLPISTWAIVVSRTRNAWLGALVGLAVVAVLRAPRTLWLLPAGVGFVLILRPSPVVDRLTFTDRSSRDRYFMWQAGIDMIRDRPVFGQGPRMVEAVYPRYRWPGAPNPATPHLHNNALQIAAERGLPCLAWWLWWVAATMGDAYREARRRSDGEVRTSREPRRLEPAWAAVATLGVLSAVMAAGLFEYNFGDSEILMFTLLVSALPYALRRERRDAAAAVAA